jgi:hypothetical protein
MAAPPVRSAEQQHLGDGAALPSMAASTRRPTRAVSPDGVRADAAKARAIVDLSERVLDQTSPF